MWCKECQTQVPDSMIQTCNFYRCPLNKPPVQSSNSESSNNDDSESPYDDALNFGKFKGVPIQDIETGYLAWLLSERWVQERVGVKLYELIEREYDLREDK